MSEGCINLQDRFGRRYRIRHEESYHAQHGAQARRPDPWMLEIACHYGTIYPHGGHLLAASIDGFPRVANRLRKLKCAQVHQDGDAGELTAVFDVDDLPKVAKIIRPRGRRQLSARQRAELVNRLQAKRKPTPQVPTQSQYTPQGGDSSTAGDSEAVEVQTVLF